eukprot:TRINITY_DN55848_c0_g1_i1.p1 TRINITY_DN55848_c0_g1~~TRINITY_DN55848_c0_g1_i1.p1  ORF type:complete len:168 (-),score=33.37 TRINITY_DN55848_c0_g1_i1:218-721(-)
MSCFDGLKCSGECMEGVIDKIFGFDVDEFAARKFLKWLTPLEIPAGPCTLSLDKATLARTEEDQINISLKGFSILDAIMTGSLSFEIPLFGSVNWAVEVTFDIKKEIDQSVKCDVTHWKRVGEVDSFQLPFGIQLPFGEDEIMDIIRMPVADSLESKINARLAQLSL